MKITVVNENDEIIGAKERNEVQQNDIYRVASLWVTNSKGEMLIGQRHINKKNNPGKWTFAVNGTVEEDETYESNIIKETKEEIGLKNVKMITGPKIRASGRHNFFVQTFRAIVDLDISSIDFDKKEIQQMKWVPIDTLINDVAKNPQNYTENFPRYAKLFKGISKKAKNENCSQKPS